MGQQGVHAMLLPNPLIKLVLLGSAMFFARPVFAQESKIETQAVRCLAMFSVSTVADPADIPLAKTLRQLSANFADV